MSDRLKELQRQRALAQEQLDWLDREIAAESGRAQSSGEATTDNKPSTPPPPAPDVTAVADEILSQYQNEAQTAQKDVKRGCFLYFFLAFALLGFGVLVLYFLTIRKA